jgi:hypothetical protein
MDIAVHGVSVDDSSNDHGKAHAIVTGRSTARPEAAAGASLSMHERKWQMPEGG